MLIFEIWGDVDEIWGDHLNSEKNTFIVCSTPQGYCLSAMGKKNVFDWVTLFIYNFNIFQVYKLTKYIILTHKIEQILFVLVTCEI